MSGTCTVKVGDRGRLVIPAELRRDGRFEPGAVLIVVDSPSGVVLLTRTELKDRVRADLEGQDLVGELMAERRRNAADEDAA